MVKVPEWGGEVAVYPLSADQYDELEAWKADNPKLDGFTLQLLRYALADLNLDNDSLRQLNQKSQSAIKRLADEAVKLCLPDYGATVKNSEADQSGESG